jgi:hypothetical protein
VYAVIEFDVVAETEVSLASWQRLRFSLTSWQTKVEFDVVAETEARARPPLLHARRYCTPTAIVRPPLFRTSPSRSSSSTLRLSVPPFYLPSVLFFC